MKKTIIFDLDGTLVDIEPLFFNIFNSLASEFGYAPLRQTDIPLLKKFPLRKLVWQQLGWRMLWLPQILKRGREEYHTLIPKISLFPGIPELLKTLHTNGLRIGIVSSSRKDTIRSIVTLHNLPIDFIYHSKLFNKAATLEQTLAREHLTLSETLYIGDEIRDVEACQKIGLDIIAVTYGLNDRQSLQATGAETIDTLQALLARLMRKS